MEKFNRTLRGYDPEEVNIFIDKIIEKVELMVLEMKQKDETIKELRALEKDYGLQKNKMTYFENMEDTLKKAILMAEKTSEQIKITAYQERDLVISDAKKNASRIVNEALIKAEAIEKESDMLKRNVTTFKRRLKDIISSQLEIVDDIEKIEV